MTVARSMRLAVAGAGLLACAGVGWHMPALFRLVNDGLVAPIKGLVIVLGGVALAMASLRLLLQRARRGRGFSVAAVLLVVALLCVSDGLFGATLGFWLVLVFAAIAAGAGVIVTRMALAAARPAN